MPSGAPECLFQQSTAVLEPILGTDKTILKPDQQHVKDQPLRCNPKLSKTGPWSLDWLAQIPAKPTDKVGSATASKGAEKFTFAASLEYSRQAHVIKKTSAKQLIQSTGFVKRIARMPSADRREVLMILKKKNRKRNVRSVNIKSKDASLSSSETSKNSTTSVNNDWVNWVAVHEKSNGVKEDVNELGKALGVKFKGDPNNSFNLLSREGRKEWRSMGGVGGGMFEQEGV